MNTALPPLPHLISWHTQGKIHRRFSFNCFSSELLSYYRKIFEATEGKSVEGFLNPLLRNNKQEKYIQNFKIYTLKQLEQIPENVKAVSSLIMQRDGRLCWITKN